MEYAIVDLETTGGDARYSRVIEVAAYAFDGKQIIDEFVSLVNPGTSIPRFITNLTGISEEMVSDAPSFEEVAKKVDEITRDRIFVAHNVGFDYSFLRNEFKRLDQRYYRRRLCTVRLSRKIFPYLRSYSLGSLCRSFDIPLENRHRAYGDARATTGLLKHLIQSDIGNHLEDSLKRYSREAMLPPHLPREDFDDLPEDPGVYYFHDRGGKVIYVGKANSLRDRVSGHFMDSEGKSSRFKSEIHNITYQLTGNELVALLLESHEIKQLWPRYNWSQKRPQMYWGLYTYEDQKGYERLAIGRGRLTDATQMVFGSYSDGWSFIKDLVRDHDLCAKLSGMQKSHGACLEYAAGICQGACVGEETKSKYNRRLKRALKATQKESESYAIIGDGRTTEESSVVLVRKGKYLGFGFIQGDEVQIDKFSTLNEYITSYSDNPDTQRIIRWYMMRNRGFQLKKFSDRQVAV